MFAKEWKSKGDNKKNMEKSSVFNFDKFLKKHLNGILELYMDNLF